MSRRRRMRTSWIEPQPLFFEPLWHNRFIRFTLLGVMIGLAVLVLLPPVLLPPKKDVKVEMPSFPVSNTPWQLQATGNASNKDGDIFRYLKNNGSRE